MNKELTKVIETIANELIAAAQTILASSEIGLGGSQAAKNVKAEIVQSNGSIVIKALFDNYVEYVDQGRAPRTGKQPPLDELRDWALERGIPTDNSTLFLISRAIWRDGVEGKPIFATLEDEIDRLFETEWADMIFDAITADLDEYFK